jgi:uncharacterized protein (TIGR02271 family)
MADAPDRIERAEERLVARRGVKLAGRVRVDRRVSEEPHSVDVDVTRDQVSIDRRAVDRPLAATDRPVMSRDGTTVLLVTEERLEVRKVPWVVEEIHVTRREVTEPQRVSGTVRHQGFDIATEGDVNLASIESNEAKRTDR